MHARYSKATNSEPSKALALSNSSKNGVRGKPQTYSKRKVRGIVKPSHKATVEQIGDVFDIPESPSKTTKTPPVLKKAPSLKNTDTRLKTQSSRNPASSIRTEKSSRAVNKLRSKGVDKQQDRSAYKGERKSNEHRGDRNNDTDVTAQNAEVYKTLTSGNKHTPKSTLSVKDKMRNVTPARTSGMEKSGMKVGKKTATLVKPVGTSVKSISTLLDQSEPQGTIPSKTRSRIRDVNTGKDRELLFAHQKAAVSGPRHEENGVDQGNGQFIEVSGIGLHERAKEATPHLDRPPTSPPRQEPNYTKKRNAHCVSHPSSIDFEQEQGIAGATSVFEDSSVSILHQPVLAELSPFNKASLSTPIVQQAIPIAKTPGTGSSNHANDLVSAIDFAGAVGDQSFSPMDEAINHQHFQDAMTYSLEDDWPHSTDTYEIRVKDDLMVASQTIMQVAGIDGRGAPSNQALSSNHGEARAATRSGKPLEATVAPQATMLPKQNRGKESLPWKLRTSLSGLVESKQQDEESPKPRRQSAKELAADSDDNANSLLNNSAMPRSAQKHLQSPKLEPKLHLNTKRSTNLNKLRESVIEYSLPAGLEFSGLPNKDRSPISDKDQSMRRDTRNQTEPNKLYDYRKIFSSDGEQESRQAAGVDIMRFKRNGRKRIMENQVESDPKRAKISVRPSTPIATTPQSRVRRLIPVSDSQPRGFDDVQQKPNRFNVNITDPHVQGTISLEENGYGAERYTKQVRPLLQLSGLHGKRKYGDWQSVDKKQIESSSLAPQLVPETPADKRRRTLNIVLPTSEDTTRSLSRLVSTPLLTAYQKASAQGTRIDPNGSPIPSLDQARRTTSGLDINRLIRDLPSDTMGNDIKRQKDSGPPEPDLPTARSSAMPRRLSPLRKVPRTTSSGNGKLLPSSPNAPSRMLSDMAAHHLQPGGDFINVETSGVIRHMEPQDPFLDDSRTNADSFIKMLRGPAKITAKFNTTEAGKTTDSRKQIDLSANRTDGDITMVGTEPRKKAQRHGASVSDSPSSRSTSSSPQCTSRQESEEGRERDLGKQWRIALKPYQKNTLDILCNISNVR